MIMFPVILVLYIAIVGVSGHELHWAKEVSRDIVVSRGQVLS